MTEADLQRVETAYGRRFPKSVREVFLDFPPELRAAAENRAPEDCGFHLHDNADWLVAVIDRRQSYAVPLDWTPSMLILGCGGCGETYWVDLDDERGPVMLFDAGEPAEFSSEFCGSLASFVRHLLAGGAYG